MKELLLITTVLFSTSAIAETYDQIGGTTFGSDGSSTQQIGIHISILMGPQRRGLVTLTLTPTEQVSNV